MKKVIFALVFCLVAATSQVFAQDMMVGGQLGYGFATSSSTIDDFLGAELESWQTAPFMSFGLFFDAQYVRVGLAYSMLAGDATAGGSYDGEEADEVTIDNSKVSTTYINLSLLGKYPVTVSEGLNLWPALGIGYDYFLGTKYDGEEVELADGATPSDLFVLLGAGLDYAVSETVSLTASAVFGYNLTANPMDEDIDGVEFSGYKYDFYIGAGMKL
jgi:opacity protein-like surface antigen